MRFVQISPWLVHRVFHGSGERQSDEEWSGIQMMGSMVRILSTSPVSPFSMLQITTNPKQDMQVKWWIPSAVLSKGMKMDKAVDS
jgi:hypothetical protein